MKTQANIVGYILLAAAITGIALGVYMWGKPLVEKGQTSAEVKKVESELRDLAKIIEDTGLSKSVNSFTIYTSGEVRIEPNKIIYEKNYPISFYAKGIKIPINYQYLYTCDKNNELLISNGNSINLCGDPNLIAKIENNKIKIFDKIYNKTLNLDIRNYKDVIIQKFVFDILVRNNKILFITKYNLGYKELGDPYCIVDGYNLGNVVRYEISCRPIYDSEKDLCYWIYISPKGSTSKKGITTINIEYKDSKLESALSTVCSKVYKIFVDISVS